MAGSTSASNLQAYLADGENLLISFNADSVERGEDSDDTPDFSGLFGGSNSTNYVFGATDQRIVYLDKSNSFKDIDYSHISSIESEIEEENPEAGVAALGCCGGFIALAGIILSRLIRGLPCS